ncbi:methionyl-tRNA formyltransferase [Candidatus Saccharibacteria bacterium CG_4_10_14_0_2_um_filter_52_9]|nr:MAG: methionyl-tRNA formyltransferase [Candidatus Saccharibacteria bacterium CG_4_10_14_0_2_um_filter_52_9]
MSNKILFFGNERLATGARTSAPTLQALIDAGYNVVAVVVAQAEAGKSRRERELEVASIAKAHDIPLLSPDKPAEAIDEIATFGAEIAVLIAYGNLLPEALLDVFPYGIINVHPSLLPLHRGSTPVESAILDGDVQTGVSLIQLTKLMDAGPVYGQQTVPLKGDETKPQLAQQLSLIGTKLVLEHLPGILDGSLQPVPQDDKQASYDEPIAKGDGRLDWNKPAVRLEREVRAYLDWPRSRTTIGSTDVIITKAHLAEGSGAPGSLALGDKQLGVYTAENILMIDSLIPAGKKEMSAEAFLAGYKSI